MTNRSSYSFQSRVDTGTSCMRDEVGLDMYLLIRRMTSGGSGIRMGRVGFGFGGGFGGFRFGFDMQKANMVMHATCQQRFNFANSTDIFL